MRVLAIVILYNPDLKLLQENLNAFTFQVDETMIWDNSPKDVYAKNEKYIHELFPHIVIQGDGNNHGISFGLNKAWKYASQKQYDVLLTMDQDSVFRDFKLFLSRGEDKWIKEGLSACGAFPIDGNGDSMTEEFLPVNHLITSGMLIPVSLLDSCGGYCQEYKIDGIDIELCYRLRKLGFQTFIDTKSFIKHRFGQQGIKKIPFFGVKYFSNYNPSRLYGIFRNHIITWRRYHYPRTLTKLIFYDYFKSYVIKDVIFFGSNKREHLAAVYKGFVDGFRYHIQ